MKFCFQPDMKTYTTGKKKYQDSSKPSVNKSCVGYGRAAVPR